MNCRLASVGYLGLAFVAGVWLYQVDVYLAGINAAIAIPKAYFAWFGRARSELALAVLDLATFALPIGIVFAGGTLATYRLLRTIPPTAFMLAFCLGVVSCFAFWVASSVLFVPELPPGVQAYPPSVRLKQLLLPPWWALPGFVAPWLGLAVAGGLIKRMSAR